MQTKESLESIVARIAQATDYLHLKTGAYNKALGELNAATEGKRIAERELKAAEEALAAWVED